MICFIDLPISFWKYVRETTVYILNRVPSKSVTSTPYKIRKGRKPNLKHFKIWGCPAYIKNIFGHKLSVRSNKYRFVGYPKKTNGYYYYHPTEQKVFVSRYTTFLKNKLIQEGGSGRNIELTEAHDLQTNLEIPMVEPQEDPQSKVLKDEVHIGKYIPKANRQAVDDWATKYDNWFVNK